MGRTACTEPQCLYKGALYLTFYITCLIRDFEGTYFGREIPFTVVGLKSFTVVISSTFLANTL
jgi:hypothetical protein